MKSPIPIKPICCCIRSTGNRAGSFLADMNGPGKESMKRKYKIAMVQMDTQNNKEKNLEDACAWIDEAAASGAELGVLSRGHEPDREKHRPRRRKGADPWIFHRTAYGKGGGAWDLYPWRQHYGGDSGRKTGLQHQRAHRARRPDPGKISEAPYLRYYAG